MQNPWTLGRTAESSWQYQGGAKGRMLRLASGHTEEQLNETPPHHPGGEAANIGPIRIRPIEARPKIGLNALLRRRRKTRWRDCPGQDGSRCKLCCPGEVPETNISETCREGPKENKAGCLNKSSITPPTTPTWEEQLRVVPEMAEHDSMLLRTGDQSRFVVGRMNRPRPKVKKALVMPTTEGR